MPITVAHDVNPALQAQLSFKAGQAGYNKWKRQYEDQANQQAVENAFRMNQEIRSNQAPYEQAALRQWGMSQKAQLEISKLKELEKLNNDPDRIRAKVRAEAFAVEEQRKANTTRERKEFETLNENMQPAAEGQQPLTAPMADGTFYTFTGNPNGTLDRDTATRYINMYNKRSRTSPLAAPDTSSLDPYEVSEINGRKLVKDRATGQVVSNEPTQEVINRQNSVKMGLANYSSASLKRDEAKSKYLLELNKGREDMDPAARRAATQADADSFDSIFPEKSPREFVREAYGILAGGIDSAGGEGSGFPSREELSSGEGAAPAGSTPVREIPEGRKAGPQDYARAKRTADGRLFTPNGEEIKNGFLSPVPFPEADSGKGPPVRDLGAESGYSMPQSKISKHQSKAAKFSASVSAVSGIIPSLSNLITGGDPKSPAKNSISLFRRIASDARDLAQFESSYEGILGMGSSPAHLASKGLQDVFSKAKSHYMALAKRSQDTGGNPLTPQEQQEEKEYAFKLEQEFRKAMEPIRDNDFRLLARLRGEDREKFAAVLNATHGGLASATNTPLQSTGINFGGDHEIPDLPAYISLERWKMSRASNTNAVINRDASMQEQIQAGIHGISPAAMANQEQIRKTRRDPVKSFLDDVSENIGNTTDPATGAKHPIPYVGNTVDYAKRGIGAATDVLGAIGAGGGAVVGEWLSNDDMDDETGGLRSQVDRVIREQIPEFETLQRLLLGD